MQDRDEKFPHPEDSGDVEKAVLATWRVPLAAVASTGPRTQVFSAIAVRFSTRSLIRSAEF